MKKSRDQRQLDIGAHLQGISTFEQAQRPSIYDEEGRAQLQGLFEQASEDDRLAAAEFARQARKE